MTDYIERFSIPNLADFCIEDDKADHPDRRFKVSHGGCGIYAFGSLDSARKSIHAEANERLRQKAAAFRETLESITETLRELGGDTFNLGSFKNNEKGAE